MQGQYVQTERRMQTRYPALFDNRTVNIHPYAESEKLL